MQSFDDGAILPLPARCMYTLRLLVSVPTSNPWWLGLGYAAPFFVAERESGGALFRQTDCGSYHLFVDFSSYGLIPFPRRRKTNSKPNVALSRGMVFSFNCRGRAAPAHRLTTGRPRPWSPSYLCSLLYYDRIAGLIELDLAGREVNTRVLKGAFPF
eukprot:GHVT01022050.1.p1 GENE.GHVT01022050.1~~GHVT01022050.1.p1  ORF type:complete len:157 (+),score=2.67 GHVT01022050.1:567-1037(+)